MQCSRYSSGIFFWVLKTTAGSVTSLLHYLFFFFFSSSPGVHAPTALSAWKRTRVSFCFAQYYKTLSKVYTLDNSFPAVAWSTRKRYLYAGITQLKRKPHPRLATVTALTIKLLISPLCVICMSNLAIKTDPPDTAEANGLSWKTS